MAAGGASDFNAVIALSDTRSRGHSNQLLLGISWQEAARERQDLNYAGRCENVHPDAGVLAGT